MARFDVFNGDADGICSLVQLRRADPAPEAVLVTGRKRRIDLLGDVKAGAGDFVTVLDVSMRSNMADLKRVLEAGAIVFYADHHNAGDRPVHDNLFSVIDTSPKMCTAMLIDDCLGGAYRAWAVTAAFGDNFPALARAKAKEIDLPLERLERLGILINYNGYGASEADLHFHPKDLYNHLKDFDTPMAFLHARPDIYEKLSEGYAHDMASAQAGEVIDETDFGLVLKLPNAASSRRVSGVYGNKLAQDYPRRAHAILTDKDDGYVVSIRAPLSNRLGADILAMKFETGGGRAAAAGINHLGRSDLERFVREFRLAYKR